MRNDIECEFINFEPDSGLQAFVRSVGQNIYDLSPSNSALKIILKKIDQGVRATCRIFSYAGVFEAEVESEKEMAAVRKLEERICYKLDVWKSRRFEKTKSTPNRLGVAM